MYNLEITAKARKELKDISLHHQKAILEAFLDIQDNPLVGKPLTREFTGKFSYRVGMFRIIYKVKEKDKIILIITAGHRSTVYQ